MSFWIPFLALAVSLAGAADAEEFDFTIPEAEKQPYEIGGRLESRFIYHRLDDEAAGYALRSLLAYTDRDVFEWRISGEISAGFRYDTLRARLLTHHQFEDVDGEEAWSHDIYEGYLSLVPGPSLTLDAGKKSVLWGKGYAWNPAGFINRPKDPDDPAKSLEGRTLLGLDLIRSFAGGPLTNTGFTLIVLPVIQDGANSELGENGDINVALKLYLLWRDTDIDIIWYDGPEQPRSLGFDFARNLAENIEVHGELALRQHVPGLARDAEGGAFASREDQISCLLGMRYLTARDTTFIVEYYHNGAGYDHGELEAYFGFQEAAPGPREASGRSGEITNAGGPLLSEDASRNLGKDYGYVKILKKDPFNLLYLTPWLSSMINLRDLSFNLQPGLTWAPVTDLEVNLRMGIPIGPANTEFGEKPDAFRTEFWLRYYF